MTWMIQMFIILIRWAVPKYQHGQTIILFQLFSYEDNIFLNAIIQVNFDSILRDNSVQ